MAWFKRSKKAELLVVSKPRATFAVPTLAQYLSYLTSETVGGPVTRITALSVPAMLRGRNLICSIGTLPLDVFDSATNEKIDNPLFRQFDQDIPNVVHLSQTLEDLILDGVAWWEVTSFGWDGFPNSVRRVDPSVVSVNPPQGRSAAPLPSGIDPRGQVVWVDGRPVPHANIIRFDSPNPGLLVYGAAAIKRAVLLDRAAKVYAENPDAAEIIRVPDEYEDAQAELFAKNYVSAKRSRSTVSLPVDVLLERPDSANPSQIQLVELQKQATIEIANLIGLDPEELGVSTTSRTYSNVNDRRRDKINDVLSPYMRSLTDRLSMPDVTKRGQQARFNLSDYLKANDTERWSNYKTAVELGVLSPQEVRDIEGIQGSVPTKPEPAPAPVPPAVEPQDATEPTPVGEDMHERPAYTFSASHKFVDLPLETFSVDAETRTITGVSVPYGKSAHGMRFEKGSLKFQNLSHVKLLRDHDPLQPLGVATDFKESNNGVTMKFRVARGAAGDDALALAEDGVLDGLSIGVDFSEKDVMPDPRYKNSILIRRADLKEVSLTAMPAFSDARVVSVKASEAEMASGENEGGAVMPEEVPVTPEATPETPAVTPAPTTPVTFTERPTVNPARPVAQFAVTEAAPYRFNRRGTLVAGSHDFAADLFQWDKFRDLAAYGRAIGFIKAQFVDDPTLTTDVNELSPTINQNKYVDEKDYAYPLWSRVGRGAPPNGVQPFSWPKFSSSDSAVATHTENTAQDSEKYVTTSQSVTPVAKSANAELSREIWDMGGTPGISDLIWRKMVRAWGEAREAVVDAALDAAESSPGIAELATFTAGGGTDYQTLAAQMEAGLAVLNFARGGFRFEFVATQADLFAHLAAARDDNGRPLYPMVAPSNTNGTVASRYATINVGGVEFVPSWAAAASGQSTPAASYLIDPTAVDAWATEPQRIDIVQSVELIQIAVWGYMAAAVNDVNGVRTITYDPVA